jgi:hypothetical protein
MPHDASAADRKLEIALVRGGSLSGKLALPEGRTHEGWMVRACDERGLIAAAIVDETGRYRLDHLHAGAWQVRAFAPGARFNPKYEASQLDTQPDVTIENERESTFDIVIATTPRPMLEGHLSLGGREVGLWSTYQDQVQLDADGRFRLPLERGKETQLTLGGRSQLYERMSIVDFVPATNGVVHWEHDVPLGEISGSWKPQNSERRREMLWYECKGEGRFAVRVALRVENDGRIPVQLVPSGHGSIYIVPLGRNNQPEVLREVEMPRDGKLELDLR